MHIEVNRRDGTAKVSLRGRFDSSCHREFRSACDGALGDPGANAIEIDFAGVEYVDNWALGALLLVRERAKAANRALRLANCRGPVGAVLGVARFSRLFPIA